MGLHAVADIGIGDDGDCCFADPTSMSGLVGLYLGDVESRSGEEGLYLGEVRAISFGDVGE